MIKEYYKDADIQSLQNPENDWYREFLYTYVPINFFLKNDSKIDLIKV